MTVMFKGPGRHFLQVLLSIATFLVIAASASDARAQGAPIKIGLSMSQTGPLAGGGKAALLGLQIWRDDVNERGGLIGRRVELVVYDDQSIPSNTPGIYTKLLDVDKVDLLIAPYGTNMTAPVMPIVKQRQLLLMGNFSFEVNEHTKHDMWFNNAPWNTAAGFSSGFVDLSLKLGAKTIALLATDGEFSQAVINGTRQQARSAGLNVVYDQKFPPNTSDFSALMRAIKSAKPDAVYLASYPGESIGLVRAINEVGVGAGVKILGGGMVGLQFAPIMESLGPQLNGIVNYNTYVPESSVKSAEVQRLLDRYSAKAKVEKVDPLGFYLVPFAYEIGEVLANAITATKTLDQKALASFIRGHEHKTVVGTVKYGPIGEWLDSRVLITQFRGVQGKGIDQFRESGRQIILYPAALKTGEVAAPFEAVRR